MAATNHTNDTPKKRGRKGGPMTSKQRATAQDAFLVAYAQTGIITKAAEAAGIGRKTVYEWQEHDEEFSLRFHEARESSNDVLRAEIHRRAVDGWEEEVYQLKEYVGTVRKFSDTLLIFQAKARMPEYREKVQVEQSGQVSITHEFANDPEAAAFARALIQRVSVGSAADASGSSVSGEQ